MYSQYLWWCVFANFTGKIKFKVHVLWLLCLRLVRSQILLISFFENLTSTRGVPFFFFFFLQPQHKQRSMYCLFFLFASAIKSVTANEQCRTEVNTQGMALKRSVFKRWSVAAPHLCDVKCGQEITCQSYNYNRKYQICELNNRTKEARPDNFLSAPGWFYIRRLNSRGKKSKVYVPRCFCFFSRFSPHSANLLPSP